VFESPAQWHRVLIKIYLSLGYKVWAIEPFHAYHYERKVRFFPSDHPAYINKLIQKGKIFLLKAKDMEPETLFLAAADRAVEMIDGAFPFYRHQHRDVIEYVAKILNFKTAENIFHKHLCERLAVFYSINMLLQKVENLLANQPIKIYLAGNIVKYRCCERILRQSRQDFFESRAIQFAVLTHIRDMALVVKEGIQNMIRLSGQAMISGLLSFIKLKSYTGEKKKYTYGMTILSSSRQLNGNTRGPNFFIDDEKIRREEVVYLPLIKLNAEERESLSRFRSDTCYCACNKWRNFSHFKEWWGLWWISLRQRWPQEGNVIHEALRALFEYFKWQKVLDRIEIKHFITHSDFGNATIARNILLHQRGIQTWYFTDSTNFPFNFRTNQDDGLMRQPAWGSLNYDHFVTWSKGLVDYFYSHQNLFKKSHIVGCLWASGIKNGGNERIRKNSRFAIAVFDSTYSRKGITSYEEGIAFAQDIMRLSREYTDIAIVFKEKKDRWVHPRLDPVLSGELLSIYNQMNDCSNIRMLSHSADSAQITSEADMIISFPFTSSTFEALSANKPAIWHDSLGYYKKTIYGRIGGVVTHSYEELRTKVCEIRNNKGLFNTASIFPGSPCIDPFCDGKAIERFRDLLVSENLTTTGEIYDIEKEAKK